MTDTQDNAAPTPAGGPAPPPIPNPGTTTAAIGDDSGSRNFPCERCGADLTFSIGDQSLKCAYCGFVKHLAPPTGAVSEQDFEKTLQRIASKRAEDTSAHADLSQATCGSCGATVQFAGTLTSQDCPYCGAPLQREHVHQATGRIPVDGVLAFRITRDTAQANLKTWVQSRWFAPNEFKKRGVQGRFSGVYLPYWTYDTMTATRYTGQRGEYYYVTVGSGKNRRTERRTRWYPASGSFQRFFDDVLVVAGTGLPTHRLDDLEPWPLTECTPFNREVLSGFMARTYDVSIEEGFVEAKQRIDEALEVEVRRRIGGDEQIVNSIDTAYHAITYKHLLLPVWMMGYRFREKPYQVVVNAATGEVQGDRPWSWIKITLAALAAAAVIGTIAWFAMQ